MKPFFVPPYIILTIVALNTLYLIVELRLTESGIRFYTTQKLTFRLCKANLKQQQGGNFIYDPTLLYCTTL